MSQLTRSANFGRSSLPLARWFAIFLMVAAALAIAAAALIAFQPPRSAEQAAPVEPAVIQPDSRQDDYGLRHPVTNTATDSRQDDYGLRHPVTNTATDSRQDDYGLRHPVP